MRHRRHLVAGVALGAALALTGCNGEGVPSDEDIATDGPGMPAPVPGPEDDDAAEPAVTATFQDAEGEEVGTVELTEDDAGTQLSVNVTGLEPGFHGLHIHDVGLCEPDSADPDDPASTGDFLSAGGHFNPDDADHGEHAGDLSSLLVTDAGEGTLAMLTDRFTVADLQDEDGAAFMIHSDLDNFAHIPDRYGEPDQDTLDTGDAGDRIACAVIE